METRKRATAAGTPYWTAREQRNGVRLEASGRTKRIAEDRLRAKLRSALLEQRRITRGPTVDEIVRSTIDASQVATQTKSRRLAAWRRNADSLGDQTIGDVSRRDVVAWAEQIPTRRWRDGQIAWEALSQGVTRALSLGLITISPMPSSRTYKPKRPRLPTEGKGRHRIRVYTPDEVEALVEASLAERLGALLPVLFDCGLRLGEALGLQWRDVDDGRLHVRRALVENEGKLWLDATKTAGSARTIALPERTREHLGQPGPLEQQVFVASNGAFLRKRMVYQLWRQVHKRATVDAQDRTPHAARHTHATRLLSSGVPLNEVARRLGHDSVQTTLQFYASWMPGDDRTRAAAEALAGSSAS